MRSWTLPLAALTAVLFPLAAHADCAAIDAARDSLSPDEQRATTALLEGALTDAGLSVTAAPCANTWMVSHIRLGSSITVRLATGSASQQMTVAQIEELPLAYERLIRAIQTGQSVATTADRDSVTSAEEAPRRATADRLAYVQLGGGVVGLSTLEGGTAIGGGYRHSLDNIAIDIGLLNTVIPGNTDDAEQFAITLVELSALYYLDGGAATSMYVGGGVGYGLGDTDGVDTRQGLQLQGTVGYEFLRQSTIRLFPQLDVVAPIYTLEGSWLPTTTLTLGIAFSPVSSRPWWAR